MSLATAATIASILVGGIVGSLTIIGLVDSSVNSPAAHPASVADASVQYGTTGP